MPIKWVVALATLALVRGFLYLAVIPPWQAPDENGHFEYARLLADHWRPLTWEDSSPALEQEIIASLYTHRAWRLRGLSTPDPTPLRLSETPYFGRPRLFGRFSLSYVPYAIAVWPFRSQPVVTQLYIMRAVSVLLQAVTIVLVYQFARRVAPDWPELAFGSAAFVLFLPQHTFIMSSVNDGNLAECLASATLYYLVQMLRLGVTPPRALVCGACLVGAIFSKATAYFLLPLSVIVGLALVVAQGVKRYRQLSPQHFLTGLLLIALLGLGLFVAPLVSYQFSFIQRNLAQGVSGLTDWNAYLAQLNAEGRFVRGLWGTFSSFWMVFGWMAIWLPGAAYLILGALCGLALLRWAWRSAHLPRHSPERQLWRFTELSAVMPVLVMLVWFVGASIGLEYFQGRYLFAGVASIALVFVAGWLSLAPQRFQPFMLGLLIVGMIGLEVWSLWFVAIPAFYPAAFTGLVSPLALHG